ncbi:hypothetical protein MTO96_033925 [Rhipicephalus appendiculatus]
MAVGVTRRDLEGCSKAYKNYRLYRMHISKCHNHLLISDTDVPDEAAGSSRLSDPQATVDDLIPDTDVPDEGAAPSRLSVRQGRLDDDAYREQSVSDEVAGMDVSSADPDDECAMTLSSLLLKWQEGKQFPEATVRDIAQDIIDIFYGI